ncbi:uncharacterized protein LOC143291643 isoform X2 [Babylonia areolata]|uniref:uncharacterized protein LOC143291643 isoform X2 n=1 Tax=Babylonia areolata TaxID=304850 RepID=UPI003FD5937D
MASAWRAFIRLFGLGKKEENKPQQPRYHPYDEISDDQIAANRPNPRPPRSHPYDEVSVEQLEENRSSVMTTTMAADNSELNYVDVQVLPRASTDSATADNYENIEIQPGARGSNPAKASRSMDPPTIYTEVKLNQ